MPLPYENTSSGKTVLEHAEAANLLPGPKATP